MKRTLRSLALLIACCSLALCIWKSKTVHVTPQSLQPESPARVEDPASGRASISPPRARAQVLLEQPEVRSNAPELRIILADGTPATGLRVRAAQRRSSRPSYVQMDGTVVPPLPEGARPVPVEGSLQGATVSERPEDAGATWIIDLVYVEITLRDSRGEPQAKASVLYGPSSQGRWLDPDGLGSARTDASGSTRWFALPGEVLIDGRADAKVASRTVHLTSEFSSHASIDLTLAAPTGGSGLRLLVRGADQDELDYQALLKLPGGGPTVRVLRSEDALGGRHWGLPAGDYEIRLLPRSRPPVSYYQPDGPTSPVHLEPGELQELELKPQLIGRLSLNLANLSTQNERVSVDLRRLPEGTWQRVEELEFTERGYSVSIDLAPGSIRRTANLLPPGHYEVRLADQQHPPSTVTVTAGQTVLASL